MVMRRLFAFFVLVFLLLASLSIAVEIPLASRGSGIIRGGSGHLAKAEVDTINLMSTHSDPTNGAGEPAYFGDFEDQSAIANWNGWTSADLSQPVGESHWKNSDYRAVTGNLSAWCGELDFPSCGVFDSLGGYGNAWNETLEWRQSVANPALPCTVTIDAWVNLDTEPAYDYAFLSVLTQDSPVTDLWEESGQINALHLQQSFIYLPFEYSGETSDEVVVQFRFISDGGRSAEDCIWPNRGAIQLDDVTVTLSNGGIATFDDFEGGTLGNWEAVEAPGAGDYAQIWTGIEDLDPCFTNYSPQVAFIDDGLVVPGTGGTMCVNWCYGPAGYIVNNEGGLSYPRKSLHNTIDSPVMDWPDSGYGGALFEFGVYHQLGLDSDEPRMYYTWSVRSADTDGSGGLGVQVIEDQPWVNRGLFHFGYGTYERFSEEVTDLLVPGRDLVQVRMAVYELNSYGSYYPNGNPTPYFDNVALKVYPRSGPGLMARSADLAQDGFPAGGTLASSEPGDISVRFDMARNIAPRESGLNDPGDSIVVSVAALGIGAVVSPAPRLEYRLLANPDFDHLRSAGLPAAGYVAGIEVLDLFDGLPTGKWSFDLPDTGFLMPGDILHYLIVATETGPGGTVQAFLPADTTGFHDFSDPLAYDQDFTMRALPGVLDPLAKTVITTGGPALFWFDAEDRAGLESWITILELITNDPLFSTFDYDLFLTREPASGLGNGLGGRATPEMLDHYGTVLYSSGTESMRTLTPSTNQLDPSDDIGLLSAWLEGEEKHLLLTGDNLVADLDRSYEGSVFADDWMGVSLSTSNVRSFISNQAAPMVVSDPAVGLFMETPSWIAYGGCVEINSFDGVLTQSGGVSAAEFTDPSGSSGVYPYAAATVKTPPNNIIVSLPYDLMFVYTDPSSPPPMVSARQALLGDVLHAFDYMWGPVGDVPDASGRLAASSHPNPFNPRATISYSVPAAGHLTVKVFDVRGSLVRTLLDEKVETGGEVVWDGRDTGGQEAASGIYFYEVRHGGRVEIGKMTLVK